MSIILNDNEFNIKNVFFDIESNKNNRSYTSTFSRINYSNEFMTLKNICIKLTNTAYNIEEFILNKYISYVTANKPDNGNTFTPCYAIKNMTGSNKIIKISGIWENNSGTFGLAYKTF
tara:strand:- start:35869 stop:36222 length:354 start_codon:yes stop_codon:yes gene_type:complete